MKGKNSSYQKLGIKNQKLGIHSKGCVSTPYTGQIPPNYSERYTLPYEPNKKHKPKYMYSNTRYHPDEVDLNVVRDYNKVQGVTHATDNHVEIVRDINYRYVSIENSSNRPIGIGIENYYAGDPAKLRFILAPGKVQDLSINSQGSTAQFIHILDPYTGKYVGNPHIFSRNSNSFVLRDGINKWWVQEFKRPSYRAAF